jgi:cbb3-type cytochrome oxidase maturation protein
MEVLAYLVPLALLLGLLGLAAFLWSLKTGQYDDLEGAAWRAIVDDDTSIAAVDRPVDSRSNAAVRAKARSAEH